VLPRRFALIRHVDYTGVSGIGVVAYGVTFADGQVVLRWCSNRTEQVPFYAPGYRPRAGGTPGYGVQRLRRTLPDGNPSAEHHCSRPLAGVFAQAIPPPRTKQKLVLGRAQ
jgi:hypothetical protein